MLRASGKKGNIVIPQMTFSCKRRLREASPSGLIPITPVDLSYRALLDLMIMPMFV